MSKKFIFFLLIVIVIIGAVFFFSQKVHTTTPGITPTEVSQMTIADKSISEKDAGDTYEVTGTYPVISNLGSVSVENNVNATLSDYVSQTISDFKDNEVTGPNPLLPANLGPSTLSISYATSTLSKAHIISVRLDSEFYSRGAAHPGHQSDTFVFDTTNGKVLTLSDLFTGNYLQVLSDYSRKALTDQLTQALESTPDADMINEGTDPTTPDNFKTFMPEADGIHLIFNEYQVGPYVIGRPEVIVPYSTLQGVINPKGELAGFAQ